MASTGNIGRRAYTVAEVAELYGVHPKTVYVWLKSGKLAGMKLAPGPKGDWRISLAALDAFDELTLRSRCSPRDVAPPTFDCEHPDDGYQIECPICGALRTDAEQVKATGS
jgi:excisionase family DNA binding protein